MAGNDSQSLIAHTHTHTHTHWSTQISRNEQSLWRLSLAHISRKRDLTDICYSNQNCPSRIAWLKLLLYLTKKQLQTNKVTLWATNEHIYAHWTLKFTVYSTNIHTYAVMMIYVFAFVTSSHRKRSLIDGNINLGFMTQYQFWSWYRFFFLTVRIKHSICIQMKYYSIEDPGSFSAPSYVSEISFVHFCPANMSHPY